MPVDKNRLCITVNFGLRKGKVCEEMSFFYCILGSRHYLAKQGQVGTLGNRHFRPTHGFFKWGFRQKLHFLHLGAKHPMQFLHRVRFLKPVQAFVLLIARICSGFFEPLSLDLTINEIGLNSPHLQTILRFWIDRLRSKSVWAALSIMLSKVSGRGLWMHSAQYDMIMAGLDYGKLFWS